MKSGSSTSDTGAPRYWPPLPGFTSGDALRGHEFHYSTILDQPDAPLADVADADGNPVPETGSVNGNVTGTFFHLITKEEAS